MRPASVAATAIVFGKYLVYAIYGPSEPTHAADGSEDRAMAGMDVWQREWMARGIASIAVTMLTLLHAVSTRWSVHFNTALTLGKMLAMLCIAMSGIAVLVGLVSLEHPPHNWDRPFHGASKEIGDYASAMFKVLWALSGWSNLNYVLGEVRDPERNLPIAIVGSLSVISSLYLLTNVAFMTVVPADVAFHSKEVLAASFSSIMFKPYVGQFVLPLIMAVSAFGGAATGLFGAGRVLLAAAQARQFPGASIFAQLDRRFGTPLRAQLFNWAIVLLLICGPPPGEAFSFLVDLTGYPSNVFFAFSIVGLLLVRHSEPEKPRPFRVWKPVAYFFLCVAVFLCVFPWLPNMDATKPAPPDASGRLPHYLAPLFGLLLSLSGVPAWYVTVLHNGDIPSAWRALRRHISSFTLRSDYLVDEHHQPLVTNRS
jgi:amino acid transporter